MYINVGMANHEKRPKQERDDIHFTHIAIPTSLHFLKPCNIEVCVLLEHVCISYTGGVCCGCWKQASAKWQSCESLCRPRARGCISGYIIVCNKMGWNGKHPLESASKSLLENFEFFAYACL